MYDANKATTTFSNKDKRQFNHMMVSIFQNHSFYYIGII